MLLQADEFYQRIRERARLASDEEARHVAGLVMRSLGQVLGSRAADRLQRYLPPEVAASLTSTAAEPDQDVDREVFIGPIVNNLHTEYGYDHTLGGLDLVSSYADNDASTRVRAVFGALKENLDPAIHQPIEEALPEEIRDWWRDA